MTKREMIKRIYAHPLSNVRRGELESLSASSLRELLESPDCGRPQMRGDEPPELTEEDEKLLDRIWASALASNASAKTLSTLTAKV
jgi:hypothetical protein